MSVPTIPHWQSLSGLQRACTILNWCTAEGIDIASIMDYQLAAAMGEAKKAVAEEDGIECDPSPMDYVHMVRVLAAFLRSRI